MARTLAFAAAALALAAVVAHAAKTCAPKLRPVTELVADGFAVDLGPGTNVSIISAPYNNGGLQHFIGHLTLAPGKSYPAHRHPEAGEVILVTGGSGRVKVWRLGDAAPVEHAMPLNGTVLVRAGDIHDVHNNGTEVMTMVIFIYSLPYTMEVYPEYPETGVYNTLEDQPATPIDMSVLSEACPPDQVVETHEEL